MLPCNALDAALVYGLNAHKMGYYGRDQLSAENQILQEWNTVPAEIVCFLSVHGRQEPQNFLRWKTHAACKVKLRVHFVGALQDNIA